MGKFWKIAGWGVAALAVLLVVGWLSLRRGDIPYRELEDKYADAGSHYVNLPGGFHVHYHDKGNPKGPTIVLVHGFFVASDTWNPWIKQLGGDYRIVTLDLPGHGLTRAPKGYHASLESFVQVLDEFVVAEHIDHFALAGSSLGGDVSWRYAIAHPQKLTALILVDAAGWPDTRPETRERDKAMAVMKNPVARFLLRDLDAKKKVREAMSHAYTHKALVTDALVQRYWDYMRAPGHRDAIFDLSLDYSTRKFATPEALAAINTPTLIMEGSQDEMVPPANAAKFATSIRGSRLILYPGLGHVIQEEDPVKTAADVRAFLQGVTKASAPQPTSTSKNANVNIFY
jgi:pimeloyl-ACP methyl ester carboxylesterase